MSDEERETSRRDFMKIMGGVAAMAGLPDQLPPSAGEDPPVHQARRVGHSRQGRCFTRRPCPVRGARRPMVVTTHEGRPTHLQGNPLHPSGRRPRYLRPGFDPRSLHAGARQSARPQGQGAARGRSFKRALRDQWEKSEWKKEGGAGCRAAAQSQHVRDPRADCWQGLREDVSAGEDLLTTNRCTSAAMTRR